MNLIAETPPILNVASKLRSFLPTDIEEEVIASSPLQKPKPRTPVNRRLVARNLVDDFDDVGPSIYERLRSSCITASYLWGTTDSYSANRNVCFVLVGIAAVPWRN